MRQQLKNDFYLFEIKIDFALHVYSRYLSVYPGFCLILQIG